MFGFGKPRREKLLEKRKAELRARLATDRAHWHARALAAESGRPAEAARADPAEFDRPLTPPSPEAVAWRAAALGALVVRARHERAIADPIESHASREQAGLLGSWLEESKLVSRLSPREADLLGRAPGAWTQDEIIAGEWQVEGLGVLLWAMRALGSLRPFDLPVDQFAVLSKVPLRRALEPFVARARLRSEAEVFEARETAERWHWRARTRLLVRRGAPAPEGTTYAEIVARAAERGHREGLLPRPLDRDFPALGRPYAALSDAEFALVRSIASERHFALNWLCGCSPEWDETPTGT